jgi:class 3 adenylate cyclase/CHASE2 domain-containing sensor protein
MASVPLFASAKSRFAWAFVLIAIAGLAVLPSEWLALWNAKLMDVGFAAWRKAGPEPAKRDVVVIGIDVEDLREFKDPRDFWHPHYGRLLTALAQAKPAVVGLDIVFPERSYHHLIPGLDQSLLKGLVATRGGQVPVVLARTVDDFSNFREIFPPYVAMVGPDAVGSVVVCKDDDEVVRRFDEYLCDAKRNKPFPSLAGVMARRLGVERDWRGWIDYRIGDAIQYVPFRDVVRWAEAGDAKLKMLEGQPVLLGFILPFEDRRTVPVDLARWEPGNTSVPGVLVHAQVLRTMLNGGLVERLSRGLVGVLVVLGAAFVFLNSGARTVALYGFYLVALAAGMLFALRAGYFFEAAGPALAASVAVGGRFVNDAVLHARERATLRNAFGGYVSPQIMDEILAGRITPGLGGRRERVCILFSDIRDFTTRSEHMAPEALIDMLNKYFNEMTRCVHEQGGTVDKFIGDGMMCFFGAPQPLASPAESGVAAAIGMLERLDKLNASFVGLGLPPLKIGIGLHLGEVVVGHVGSDERHEYTVIGDPVNTASRIEGLCKSVGYPLVVSKDVWAELREQGKFTPLGEHAVKGRSAVQVYGYTANPQGEAL